MAWPPVAYTLDLFARTARGDEPDHHSRSWSYRDMRRVQGEIDRLRGAIRAALEDFERRDEVSAVDGLRAALSKGGESGADR